VRRAVAPEHGISALFAITFFMLGVIIFALTLISRRVIDTKIEY